MWILIGWCLKPSDLDLPSEFSEKDINSFSRARVNFDFPIEGLFQFSDLCPRRRVYALIFCLTLNVAKFKTKIFSLVDGIIGKGYRISKDCSCVDK